MGKRYANMTPEEKERHRGAVKKYREENREADLARKKRYRETYPEVAAASAKTWREASREAVREWKKAYRKANRPLLNELSRRRYATKLQATPPWLTEAHIAEMRETYAFAQAICGHVDHIVPLVSPLVCGLHVPWNLQVLDPESNLVKGARRWPGMWKEAA